MSAQALDALAYGNGIRLARSAAKKQLRAREITVGEMLELACCQSMMVGGVLEAQWSWGPARTVGFLSRLAITPSRRVGQLTARQRALIVGGLS